MKRILIILACTFSSVVLALILNLALHRTTNKVIAEWKQTDAAYDSRGPYYLSVVEGNVDWSFWQLGWERHYAIYVGRDNGEPSYGHWIEFSFHPSEFDFETHVKNSIVEWSEAGVTFNEVSGHKLFIPKQMFIGGR